MCRPTYFSVSYTINPWMDNNIGKVDQELSTIQWLNLRNTIEDNNYKILEVNPVKDLPDIVFTANAAVILPNKQVIVSNFKKSQRKNETFYYKEWFEKNDYTVIDVPNDIAFEGAGDALYDSYGYLWMGNGFRTDSEAVNFVRNNYRKTFQLNLINPSFYHLDTCFCPLENGHLIYYPGAFDNNSIDLIYEIFDGKAIAVSENDANKFACNAVNLGSKIILNDCSDELVNKLADIYFEVIKVDMSEFMKSGGSCKCLTLKI